MVDKLIATNPTGTGDDWKVLVVIDAGIASQENLDLIKQKGYNYLCVSRKALTDYTVDAGGRSSYMTTSSSPSSCRRYTPRARTTI